MLHVLAHVPVGRIAASCHEPRWIAYAEALLGPARDRPLAEDIAVLSLALADHATLSAAHGVAWIWAEPSRARAAAGRDLAALGPGDVDDTTALALARSAGPCAEILRAAAELEVTLVAKLAPVAEAALDELRIAIEAIVVAAPPGEALAVTVARPLVRRGRAFGRTIVTGAPGIAGATAEHLAWQVLHEASVRAAHRALGREASFEGIERRALDDLSARARAAGLGVAHARWLATLDLGDGGRPE
ncbi:MAG: hypothetical protein JST00_22620 [Deltaproteobacteria bacterium]|nr:hypothetical protein [Deltaproteobacteria bacterium]